MTRAQGPDDEIDYASSGTPGAERTMVVLRTGQLATIDPGHGATRAHDVHVVLVHLEGPELDDPPAFGGETPAGSTASALARIVERESPGAWITLLAERDTCAIALSLAGEPAMRIERLVLVAPVVPDEQLQRDLAIPLLQSITAPSLLVAAETDPGTVAAAEWYAAHVPDASTMILPRDAVSSPDGRLALADAWESVLGVCAPPR